MKIKPSDLLIGIKKEYKTNNHNIRDSKMIAIKNLTNDPDYYRSIRKSIWTAYFNKSQRGTHKEMVTVHSKHGTFKRLQDVGRKEKPKESWQMTREEYDKYQQQLRSNRIDEWNKSGSKGFPPGNSENSITNRISLAEKAGYDPKDIAVQWTLHKLHVAVALKQDKKIPKNVLEEYPDLKNPDITKSINNVRLVSYLRKAIITSGKQAVKVQVHMKSGKVYTSIRYKGKSKQDRPQQFQRGSKVSVSLDSEGNPTVSEKGTKTTAIIVGPVGNDQSEIKIGDKSSIANNKLLSGRQKKVKKLPGGTRAIAKPVPDRRDIEAKVLDGKGWAGQDAWFDNLANEAIENEKKFLDDLEKSSETKENKLVLNSLDSASRIARTYYKSTYSVLRGSVDYHDIEGEAFLGLCEAAQRFDESKGYKFMTYAKHFIMKQLRTIKTKHQTAVDISDYHIRRILTIENTINKQAGLTSAKRKEIRNKARPKVENIENQKKKKAEFLKEESRLIDQAFEEEQRSLGTLPVMASDIEAPSVQEEMDIKAERRNRKINALVGVMIEQDFNTVMDHIAKIMSVKESLAMKMRLIGYSYGEIGNVLKEYHGSGGKIPEIMKKLKYTAKATPHNFTREIPKNVFFKHEMARGSDPEYKKKLTPEMKKVHEARFDKTGKVREGGIRGVAERLGLTYHPAAKKLKELENFIVGGEKGKKEMISTGSPYDVGRNYAIMARQKFEKHANEVRVKLGKKPLKEPKFKFMATVKGK